MATLLGSTVPNPMQRPPTFSTLHYWPTSFQRIPTVRSTNQPSRTLQASSGEWSFEQRMEEALHVLNLMDAQGMSPDPSLFCLLLQSCADAENLETGKFFHQKIVEFNLLNDPFVANNLITMYAKCGCLKSARRVFDEMPERNIVSWTTVISMYSQAGFPDEALDLFKSMKLSGKIKPNAFTYSIALNSCAKTGNLNMGIEIHEDVVKDGCESDGFIVTALIDMYAKCGRIDDSRKVFDGMTGPMPAACTAIIEGYTMSNQGREAMAVIQKFLQRSGGLDIVKEVGFPCMIRACIIESALRQGQEIHAHVIKFRHGMGARMINALVVLYEKCNRMAAARHLFDELLVKDVILWGRMISGYVRNGLYEEALKLYSKMVSEDVQLDPFVILWVLNACLHVLGLVEGKEIHGRVIKSGSRLYEASVIGGLVKLYSKCGKFEDASRLKKFQSK